MYQEPTGDSERGGLSCFEVGSVTSVRGSDLSGIGSAVCENASDFAEGWELRLGVGSDSMTSSKSDWDSGSIVEGRVSSPDD